LKQKIKMKKDQKRAIVAAAIVASQLAINAANAQSQSKATAPQKIAEDSFLKIKLEKSQQKAKLVACLDGSPVFKLAKGELFTIDAETGDMKTVSTESYIKLNGFEKQFGIVPGIKYNGNKMVRKPISFKYADGLEGLQILGVDKDGHVIQQTAKGEKFFLDPATGDMVDYVGHVTLLR
jgi:hypothetical protein